MILITGGAGFIGSNFVLDWLALGDEPVVNVDRLTYAGNPTNLAGLECDPRHLFVQCDIGDSTRMGAVLTQYRPRAIVHFAAETHVDRSINGPAAFIDTNVSGTFRLLETARAYWSALAPAEHAAFRFLHVSTDEVYGSLDPADAPFTETSRYAPNSPYSASKAAADHLVRAWFHTYGLPVLTSACSNNYGPMQFPEKLIPLAISRCRAGLPVPVYGDGAQVRDWLHVADHCAALRRVLAGGRPGEVYNVGGWNEKTNLAVVHALCDLLDELDPQPRGSHRALITHVEDRVGHDRRYAVDAGKIARELGWTPAHSFDSGLRATVEWYLANAQWLRDVQAGRAA